MCVCLSPAPPCQPRLHRFCPERCWPPLRWGWGQWKLVLETPRSNKESRLHHQHCYVWNNDNIYSPTDGSFNNDMGPIYLLSFNSKMWTVDHKTHQVIIASSSSHDIRHSSLSFPDESYELEDDSRVVLNFVHQTQVDHHLKVKISASVSKQTPLSFVSTVSFFQITLSLTPSLRSRIVSSSRSLAPCLASWVTAVFCLVSEVSSGPSSCRVPFPLSMYLYSVWSWNQDGRRKDSAQENNNALLEIFKSNKCTLTQVDDREKLKNLASTSRLVSFSFCSKCRQNKYFHIFCCMVSSNYIIMIKRLLHLKDFYI